MDRIRRSDDGSSCRFRAVMRALELTSE